MTGRDSGTGSGSPHQGTTSLLAVIGTVERGDQRGRQLGFPTANLAVEQAQHLDGVWAGWVDVGPQRYAAAVSVGTRPTFYGQAGFRLLEAHLLGFDGDLYEQVVVVWFAKWLRAQRRFENVAGLVEQLQLDIESTRAWLQLHESSNGDGLGLQAPRPGEIIRVGVAA